MSRRILLVIALATVFALAVACAPATPTAVPFTPPADALGVVKLGPSDPVHIAYMLVTAGA